MCFVFLHRIGHAFSYKINHCQLCTVDRLAIVAHSGSRKKQIQERKNASAFIYNYIRVSLCPVTSTCLCFGYREVLVCWCLVWASGWSIFGGSNGLCWKIMNYLNRQSISAWYSCWCWQCPVNEGGMGGNRPPWFLKKSDFGGDISAYVNVDHLSHLCAHHKNVHQNEGWQKLKCCAQLFCARSSFWCPFWWCAHMWVKLRGVLFGLWIKRYFYFYSHCDFD